MQRSSIKNLIFLLIALALVVGVVVIYKKSRSTEETVLCIQVITSAKNRETGEVKEFPTPCDVPEGWDTLENGGNEEYQENGQTFQKYRNADLGLSFTYRKFPNGYTLIEKDGVVYNDQSTGVDVEKVYILMDTEEYNEFASSTIPREGPPTIAVTVMKNPNSLSLENWVKTQTQWSLYNLGDKVLTSREVGGARALGYTADGLYPNDMIVVENNSRIYIISGAYINPNDPIREDFQTFVKSLLFF